MAKGHKNIAIIVPNLPERRAELERILQETVDPPWGSHRSILIAIG